MTSNEVAEKTDADQRRDFIVAAALAGYVITRMVVALSVDPRIHNDTPSYLDGVSFFGHAKRTWVFPLLLESLETVTVLVVVQAAVSATAFVLFASTIATTIRDQSVRYAVLATVLALSLAPRLTAWDAVVLPESLAISLTALVIAALIRIERVPWWAFCGLFVVWLFLRDAHLFTGGLLVLGLTVWGYRRRQWVIPAVCAAVLVWASVAQQQNRWNEGFSVAFNVAYRVDKDPSAMSWFRDHGMPDSQAFTAADFLTEYRPLYDDPVFREWAETDGPTTYVRYVAAHPEVAVQGFERIFIDGDHGDEALVDDTTYRSVFPAGLPIWPNEASAFTASLVAAALVASLFAARAGRVDHRWLLPTLLAGSTIPIAFLTYHASLIEFGRHGTELSFVLVMSSVWVLALCADGWRRSAAA